MQKYVHPLTGAMREIVQIFTDMGFAVADGPERETDWYNFTALNFPKDHPARDMQDTLWVKDGTGMRTHTSPVQVRWMETHAPPIRIIVPGKVYRNEPIDMTHEAQFYQIEALAVGPDISLAHLKGTLQKFFSIFFGGSVEVRLRPSFFPFTEPSVAVDMRLTGGGAPGKLKDKWIEVMGACFRTRASIRSAIRGSRSAAASNASACSNGASTMCGFSTQATCASCTNSPQ